MSEMNVLRPQRRKWIGLEFIEVPANRLDYDEAVVTSLVESIEKVGLLHPVSVRIFDDEKRDQHIVIVSARKRLEALIRLGVEEVECVIIESGGTLIAELTEIDENLCRGKLTQAQEAAAISRRKEIYEALHPEVRHGGDRRSSSQNENLPLRFTAETARSTGSPSNQSAEPRPAARRSGLTTSQRSPTPRWTRAPNWTRWRPSLPPNGKN